MKKLNGKVALVTGSSKGIGAVTAMALAENGAKVIVNYNGSESAAEEVVAKIKAFGGDAIALKADVSKDNEVEKLGADAFGIVSNAGNMKDIFLLQKQVKQYTENIDLLFVNAGYGTFAPIEYVDEAHFDELFNLLVKGTFFTVQQIAPLMKKDSAIILNTSVVTEMGMQNFSIYSAAKSAVQSFIKTFASEFTEKGIRVNGISPGYIKTNGFNNTGLSPEQIEGAVQSIIPTIPFKR